MKLGRRRASELSTSEIMSLLISRCHLSIHRPSGYESRQRDNQNPFPAHPSKRTNISFKRISVACLPGTVCLDRIQLLCTFFLPACPPQQGKTKRDQISNSFSRSPPKKRGIKKDISGKDYVSKSTWNVLAEARLIPAGLKCVYVMLSRRQSEGLI